MTIEIPGKDSVNMRPVLLDKKLSELFHFIIALTRISGDINLKISVNKAKGHNNSGEIDA